ncbi:rubrerythrin [Lutispora saccharofermentans]|jgi:rubrerythrin|uniref:Rubrerythrin n=1 Tax=Lutispora saccharofermentans TaxID=3024236 RepID=A0ABT1NEU2_9FIRM|nr:rubrerythrin [Lutispora saccharofermentans]MCQ1529778.1 rubrerythrin [Lutispora saccharofermentans]
MSDDKMNTRDCLQRAWMNTMEQVRDFEMYSKRIEDEKVADVFKKFAEEQGMQASSLKEMYNKYEQDQ